MKTKSITILCILCLAACNFDQTKPKTVNLTSDLKVLTDSISQLYPCTSVTLSGSISSVNGSNTDSTVELILTCEGKYEKDKMRDLTGKKIAVLLKHSMAQPGDFNIFKIGFTWKENNGNMVNSNTEEQYYPGNQL
jgi:hypothetical protein